VLFHTVPSIVYSTIALASLAGLACLFTDVSTVLLSHFPKNDRNYEDDVQQISRDVHARSNNIGISTLNVSESARMLTTPLSEGPLNLLPYVISFH
jgi:hypothetical protein